MKKEFIFFPFIVSLLTYISAAELIIEENFTDGTFDNPNWHLFGTGKIGFKKLPNRGGLTAFVRNASGGGSRWSGVKFAVWHDYNKDGQWNNGELKKFVMDMTNDIFFLKFVAFSDLAHRNENMYGVEVAMLEWADELSGHPHYSHDLSFEAMLRFPISHPNQLDANVENIGVYEPFAHWEGKVTSSILSMIWTNLVIWRPVPVKHITNCEIFGHRKVCDKDTVYELKSMLKPDRPFIEFDHIQITLFTGNIDANTFIREGINADEACIGITFIHAGITKRCDFNLDYTIDEKDFLIIKSNWLNHTGCTLLNGDADNDKDVDIDDAGILCGWLKNTNHTEHSLIFTVDKKRIELECKNINWIKIESEKDDIDKLLSLEMKSLDQDILIQKCSGFIGIFSFIPLNGKIATGVVKEETAKIPLNIKYNWNGNLIPKVYKF